MNKYIVLVEDDNSLRESYTDLLKEEGYEIVAFANQHSALSYIQNPGNLPDCFLLDIELANEKEGGFQLCADIRKISKTVPIIFLTSIGNSELNRISALRLDADDYLSKKVSMEFLVTRLPTSLTGTVNQ